MNQASGQSLLLLSRAEDRPVKSTIIAQVIAGPGRSPDKTIGCVKDISTFMSSELYWKRIGKDGEKRSKQYPKAISRIISGQRAELVISSSIQNTSAQSRDILLVFYPYLYIGSTARTRAHRQLEDLGRVAG